MTSALDCSWPLPSVRVCAGYWSPSWRRSPCCRRIRSTSRRSRSSNGPPIGRSRTTYQYMFLAHLALGLRWSCLPDLRDAPPSRAGAAETGWRSEPDTRSGREPGAARHRPCARALRILRTPRSTSARRRLLVPCPAPARRREPLHVASRARRAIPPRARLGVVRGRRRALGRAWADPRDESASEERHAQRRRASLQPLARADRRRTPSPAACPDDERLLQDVSCRRVPCVVQQRASVQFVQQPVLPRQRQGNPQGRAGARRQRAAAAGAPDVTTRFLCSAGRSTPRRWKNRSNRPASRHHDARCVTRSRR